MSKPNSATRFAVVIFFTMTLTCALAITFAPLAFGQGCGTLSQEICDAEFGGGNGPDNDNNDNNDNNDPPPPQRNRANETAIARTAAQGQVTTQLQAVRPQWQVWPPKDANQIVFLPSFLAISDAGWTDIVGYGEIQPSSVTWVRHTATPTRTFWTLTETSGDRNIYEFTCPGQGSPWSPGADPEGACTWTPEHTSDYSGLIELQVVIEYEVREEASHASGGFLGTRSSAPAVGFLTVSEVQAIGSTDYTSDRDGNATVVAPAGDGTIGAGDSSDQNSGNDNGGNSEQSGGDQNSGDQNSGEQNSDSDYDPTAELPTSSIACTATISAGGHVLLGGELGAGLQLIVEEHADGTHVVTLAVQVGGSAGIGGSLGAYATVGNRTYGAFAKAEAEIWVQLAQGSEYVIGPDEDFDERLRDIVHGELVAKITPAPVGTLGSILGAVPGVPDLPVRQDADATFVGIQAWLEAGGNVQAGAGLVNVHGVTGGEAGITRLVEQRSDGSYSIISIAAGGLNQSVLTQNESGQQAGPDNFLEGSLTVETVYAPDGEALEIIVTQSYSADAGALSGTSDNLTRTTQQWRIDLTNDTVAGAILELDEIAGPVVDVLSNAPGANDIFLAKALFNQHATTTGPVEQNVTVTENGAGVGAGLGIDFETQSSISCVELS